MLFRAASRFLIMILVLVGVRIGACSGPVRHTNTGPLRSAAQIPDGDAPSQSDVRARQEQLDRDSDYGRDRDGPRSGSGRSSSDASSEALIRAIVEASRERRAAQYRPGQPMSEPTPSR